MASVLEHRPVARRAAAVAVPRRRVPRAMWVCMAVAVVNAFVWSVLTPSFQTPDEPVQAGYVQYLAETGNLPKPTTNYFSGSPEEDVAFAGVPFSLESRPTWSATQNRQLMSGLSRRLGRTSQAEAAYAAGAPPLYFALAAIPYKLASSGNFFDRLYAMRFLSVLLAGVTVGFVFLFMRELLPSRPRAWTVGALAVALQPVFGSIAGGVNYDNLLWTACAALFWLVARAFRRGLTPRLGAGIGAAVAVGLLTKGSTIGLLPGLAVALVALVARAPDRRRALLGVGATVAAAALPFGAWLLASTQILNRTAVTATGAGLANVHTTLGGELDYLWQFYLPHLPFMQHQWFWSGRYPQYPLWQTYFQGLVGRFGWFAYGFPVWVNWLALAIFLVIVALVVRGLRGVVRGRRAELAVYVVMAIGVGLLVNAAGYRYRLENNLNFEQTRYLFPLLPLYGALIAVAARGAGRRSTPVVAGVLVVLALAQDVFAQLLTVGHYYA